MDRQRFEDVKNIDTYWNDIREKVNPQNKNFSWKDMAEHRRKESKGIVVEELQARERPGICDKCGRGRFKQVVRNRQLIRICKTENCKDEILV